MNDKKVLTNFGWKTTEEIIDTKHCYPIRVNNAGIRKLNKKGVKYRIESGYYVKM